MWRKRVAYGGVTAWRSVFTVCAYKTFYSFALFAFSRKTLHALRSMLYRMQEGGEEAAAEGMACVCVLYGCMK